jgi:hypothetical protein
MAIMVADFETDDRRVAGNAEKKCGPFLAFGLPRVEAGNIGAQRLGRKHHEERDEDRT